MLGYFSNAVKKLLSNESISQVENLEGHASPIEQGTAVIVLLGRSRSGKTSLVETAYSESELCGGETNIAGTSSVSTTCLVISGKRFKLVDPPGFDNFNLSNTEVFSKTAGYLLHPKRAKSGVTGVLYLHYANDPLDGRALAQNTSVLFEVFLGDSGLSRLTIVVLPETPGDVVSPSAMQRIAGARVFQAAQAKGAKILASTLHPVDVDNILMSYASQQPILLHIQNEAIRSPQLNIAARIQQKLGYYEEGLIQQQSASYRTKIQSLVSMLRERDSQLSEAAYDYEQIEQQLSYSQEETSIVRQKLDQIQKEYASLRSQLQLHENVEQGEIVQNLKDLNRSVDDFSRLTSAYIVDTYVEAVFGKDPSEITTLDARHLPELKSLFGHMEGESSLVMSSVGEGMLIEDFLDYGIRSLLCGQLSNRIFEPFHPGTEPSQNEVLSLIYADLQRREPQAVSAQWRANSFKGLCNREGVNIDTDIEHILQHLIHDGLSLLIEHVFGPEAGVQLLEHHIGQLRNLVRAAWDWNLVLKGKVVMLGDFHLTYHAPPCRFDGTLMTEFEPNRQNLNPQSVIGTLGLGLISLRAVGNEHVPEKTVVYKAVVATETLY